MRAAFIIPYFGKFNNYFNLFLESISNKKIFDFYIFSDDTTQYNYSNNIYFNYFTLSDFNELFRKKLGYKVNISRPYKICDFRPCYGVIFSDYIKDYDYWGYCDTDLIFGDLDSICEPLLNKKYDKIFSFGHCTLIRNTYDNNFIFLSEEKYKKRFNQVIFSPRNCSFDEEFNNSINNIFLEKKKSVYFENLAANIYTKSNFFKLTNYSSVQKKYIVSTRLPGFFIFNENKLNYYEKHKDSINITEYLYIHLQSRTMRVNVSNLLNFKIIPNAFEDIEVEKLDYNNFSDVKKWYFNNHYIKHRLKNLKVKLRRKLDKNFYG